MTEATEALPRPGLLVRGPFYYGWVNLGVAAAAIVGTLPGRTQGLGSSPNHCCATSGSIGWPLPRSTSWPPLWAPSSVSGSAVSSTGWAAACVSFTGSYATAFYALAAVVSLLAVAAAVVTEPVSATGSDQG